jgi:hypothetical protein
VWVFASLRARPAPGAERPPSESAEEEVDERARRLLALWTGALPAAARAAVVAEAVALRASAFWVSGPVSEEEAACDRELGWWLSCSDWSLSPLSEWCR